jgi:hypothetical protein
MLNYGHIPKSKKKKTPKVVKQQHDVWLDSVSKMSTNFAGKYSSKRLTFNKPFSVASQTYQRETRFIESKNPDNMSPCVKKENKQYTGDAMLGIGTLHKSNAVPVFSSEEAVAMANMRR